MKKWITSALVLAGLIVVASSIGFYNFGGGYKSSELNKLPELALNSEDSISLPFDASKFANTMLSCTNKGKTAKNVSIEYLTANGGAAYTLTVKKGATVNKYVKDIAKEIGITTKIGTLSIAKDADLKCYYKGVGTGVNIEADDVTTGESYVLDTTSLFDLTNIVNHQLVIFNAGFSDAKFKVKTYLEDGELEGEQSVTVKALNRSTTTIKNVKNKTIHIVPETGVVEYLPLIWATVTGKSYVFKGVRTFENAVITPKGVLSVANVTQEPARFRYIVTSNNQKIYEGEEWVLSFGQRKIDLSELSSYPNLKMELTPVSYHYPYECEGCERYTPKINLVMNDVTSKTTSPSVVKNTTERFSDEIRNNQKVERKLPVACDIDTIAGELCGQDNNSNGIDDAEEVFHYFADPTAEDADGDGFSNAEEIGAGTLAYHPMNSPENVAEAFDGFDAISELFVVSFGDWVGEGLGLVKSNKGSVNEANQKSSEKSNFPICSGCGKPNKRLSALLAWAGFGNDECVSCADCLNKKADESKVPLCPQCGKPNKRLGALLYAEGIGEGSCPLCARCDRMRSVDDVVSKSRLLDWYYEAYCCGCPYGEDCIQKLEDGRECCGTVVDERYLEGRQDVRCTDNVFVSGENCSCCVDLKDDPNHCSHKC